MKNLTLLTFLVITFSQSAIGQFDIDVVGGINHSSASFENYNDIISKPRQGYFIGLASGYHITEKVRFQTSVHCSRKGYNREDNGNFPASNIRYSYLDVIPELEYSLLENLAIGLGVNYGTKLKEESKNENQDWRDSGVLNLITSSDFGITGKVKYKIKKAYAFIRYNHGLKNIENIEITDSTGIAIEGVKQSNRNLHLGIGYTIF